MSRTILVFFIAIISSNLSFANESEVDVNSRNSEGGAGRELKVRAETEACRKFTSNGADLFPFKYPDNIDALLRNILYAVKSRVLVDKRLYTVDGFGNLVGSISVQYFGLDLSGGARVRFSKIKGDREFLGFPDPDRSSFIDEISLSYSGGAGITSGGTCFGTMLINFPEGSFPLGAVENAFGRRWKEIIPQEPPSVGFKPSTSPDGNKYISYDFSDDIFTVRMVVGTSFDGTVHTIRIDLKEIK